MKSISNCTENDKKTIYWIFDFENLEKKDAMLFLLLLSFIETF
jgi:hypothetical protein